MIKGEIKMANKEERRRMITRIIAAFLAALMFLSMCGTLLYYIFSPK